MRYIGMDVGRDFAHAAVVEGTGSARKLGRLRMGEELAAFAATLGPDDAVALEASGNTWALAELLGRHAGRVVVSNPLRTRAIADAKHKTDDIDAATLAELLADERLALDSALRLNAVLDAEVDLADRAIATALIHHPRVHHLLTIPGIGLVTAAGILAVVGDIGRMPRPAPLGGQIGR